MKNDIGTYLENIALLILGITLLAFPIIFTTATTDPFALPKQALIGAGVLATLILLGVKMAAEGAVRIRRTPFDVPIVLFVIIAFISSFFSTNRADALLSLLPLVFGSLFYFLVVQFAKTKQAIFFLLSSLVVGSAVASLISFLSYFKIYVLPFEAVRVQQFTPFGSLLDQGLYLLVVLPAAMYLGWPIIHHIMSRGEGHEGRSSATQFSSERQNIPSAILFSLCTVVIVAGLVTTTVQLVSNPNLRPPILPWDVGFQTSFAAISQDTSRQFGVFQGFLFGSGYGTYATDFTRFKPQSLNLDQSLWSLLFLRSSNLFFDLLATTGILGLASFLFVVFRSGVQIIKSKPDNNPLYFSLLLALVSLLLPTSFIGLSLLMVVLGLFSAVKLLRDSHGFFEVELYFGASKRGGFMSALPSFMPVENGELPARHPKVDQSFTKALPVSFAVAYVIFAGVIGWFLFRYVASDVLFQSSLVAANQNNGLQTYNGQIQAINLFDQRDAYHRIFSQTNFALANSLASSLPQDATPSAETQQTITGLIQQSINYARNATVIAPLTAANWDNLSQIYRNLIGFGENAEQFAVASARQAIALDPNNPQLYISLGGVFYQLQMWDQAIEQFTIAANLKPDLANAYYNLGHAYEEKGDYQTALTAYQQVKALLADDQEAVKRMDSEIAALEKKSGTQAGDSQAQAPTNDQDQPSSADQPPLNVSSGSATQRLPGNTQIDLPEPPTSISPSPRPSTTPTPRR